MAKRFVRRRDAADASRLHPRSPFRARPVDFAALAAAHAELAPFVDAAGRLDFSRPEAQRALAAALLADYFGLRHWRCPPDRLCPMVPNRCNYLLWLADLLGAQPGPGGGPARGVDVGVGANCIFPLLGCALFPEWRFVGLEVDAASAESAEANVRAHGLEGRVDIRLNPKNGPPRLPDDGPFDFVMTNPPFFPSLADARRRPDSACTGAEVELVAPGGEVAFVGALVDESLRLRGRVRWYTAMLGHKASLKALRARLRAAEGVADVRSAELAQGHTSRWALGWSFAREVAFDAPPGVPPAEVAARVRAVLPDAAVFQAGRRVAVRGGPRGAMEGLEKERKVVSAVKDIPWLTHLLTVSFFGILALVPLLGQERMLQVGACTLGAAVVTKVTVLVTGAVAPVLSKALLSAPPMNDPLRKQVTLDKVCEQSWQLAVHTIMAVLEYRALTGKAWYYDTLLLWVPIPWLQDEDELIQLCYVVQLGVWIWTGFSCRFIEHRRKDFYVMMLHHVATCTLVLGSLYYGYTRFGIIVLYLHDISDIFVDLLKIFNYLKLEGAPGLFLTEITFASTIGTWLYYRLYRFPVVYIRSAIWESPVFMLNRSPDLEMPAGADLTYNVMLSLVHVLTLLHIYWFYLFLRMGYRAFLGTKAGAHKAAAEHMEGDSDDE